MKTLVLVLAALAVLGAGVTVAMAANEPAAPTVRTNTVHDGYQYVIPPAGTFYCFTPEEGLPADLPACPNSSRPIPPAPKEGPTLICPSPYIPATLPNGNPVCVKT